VPPPASRHAFEVRSRAQSQTTALAIVLGCLLALKRRGHYGLLFLDGHADFYQPEAEPNGEAASMDLALATSRGPAVITDLEGRRPLVREEDVVLRGGRHGPHGRNRRHNLQPQARR